MHSSSALRAGEWATRPDEREFEGLLRRYEQRERVERRLRTLGAVHLALSVPGLLCAVIALVTIAPWGLLSGDPLATVLLGGLGGGAAALLAILSVPWLVSGLGLLGRRPWARVYAVMLAVLMLGWFPLGTLLGAYTLFALLPSDAQHYFERR